MKLGPYIDRVVGTPTTEGRVAQLTARDECRRVLDVGCGARTPLGSQRRPGVESVGLDISEDALERARAAGLHDRYIEGDILATPVDQLLERAGGPFDVVIASHVIEHLPKAAGHDLLVRCEQLTDKFIVIETPNGFLEQGPEYGNPHQRHLSGWFAHEFEGYGYRVFGTGGTKYMRGYAGHPKRPFTGWYSTDLLLSALLGIANRPRHAFALVAVKDVRGVPARLGQDEAPA